MRLRHVDLVSYFAAILGGIIIIIIVLGIDPVNLQNALGPLVPPDMVMDYETLFIWRERVIDTLAQVLVLAAALMGVLAFLLRGERHG
jgi:hypothetical protein